MKTKTLSLEAKEYFKKEGKRGGDKTAIIYGRSFFQENQRKSVEARRKNREKKA